MVWGGERVLHSPQGVMFSRLCSPNQLTGEVAPTVSLHCFLFLTCICLFQVGGVCVEPSGRRSICESRPSNNEKVQSLDRKEILHNFIANQLHAELKMICSRSCKKPTTQYRIFLNVFTVWSKNVSWEQDCKQLKFCYFITHETGYFLISCYPILALNIIGSNIFVNCREEQSKILNRFQGQMIFWFRSILFSCTRFYNIDQSLCAHIRF